MHDDSTDVDVAGVKMLAISERIAVANVHDQHR
jgi:hypothetical protein